MRLLRKSVIAAACVAAASLHPGTAEAAQGWWTSLRYNSLEQWATLSSDGGHTGRLSGDFNGDGRDDIADFHAPSSRWFVTLGPGHSVEWADFSPDGDPGWVHPVAGDFNGDGRDDIATFYRPQSSWWVVFGQNQGAQTRGLQPGRGRPLAGAAGR